MKTFDLNSGLTKFTEKLRLDLSALEAAVVNANSAFADQLLNCTQIKNRKIDMSTKKFITTVAAENIRPKAVFISQDLFRALDAEELFEFKLMTPNGVYAPFCGLHCPFFDSDIFVMCDLNLHGYNFKLSQPQPSESMPA